jgi:ESCRT-II complex subunit VPS22
MRRGVGVGAVQQRAAAATRAAALGDSLAADRARHVEEQLATFRKHLETFAAKYRAEINRDPEFRRAFVRMAKSVGVDPLASAKGFWGELLGLGDYYYELAVQAVEVCLSTRAANGGLLALSELRRRLAAMRPAAAAGGGVSEDDVKQALRKLASLGGGYELVHIGGERFVLSVPAELSSDTSVVLQRCGEGGAATPGAVTVRELSARLGWPPARVAAACDHLVRDGLAWVDDQHPEDPAAEGANEVATAASPAIRRPSATRTSRAYYFPALWRPAAAAGTG